MQQRPPGGWPSRSGKGCVGACRQSKGSSARRASHREEVFLRVALLHELDRAQQLWIVGDLAPRGGGVTEGEACHEMREPLVDRGSGGLEQLLVYIDLGRHEPAVELFASFRLDLEGRARHAGLELLRIVPECDANLGRLRSDRVEE